MVIVETKPHRHRLIFERVSKKGGRLVFGCARCGKTLIYRRDRIHMLCQGISRFVKKDRTN